MLEIIQLCGMCVVMMEISGKVCGCVNMGLHGMCGDHGTKCDGQVQEWLI